MKFTKKKIITLLAVFSVLAIFAGPMQASATPIDIAPTCIIDGSGSQLNVYRAMRNTRIYPTESANSGGVALNANQLFASNPVHGTREGRIFGRNTQQPHFWGWSPLNALARIATC